MKAALVVLSAIVPVKLLAQDVMWPGARYDESVPSFESVLGHGPGERIVSHAEILRYLEALAEAVPGQVRIFEYARSWEGRALIYVVIGSEANIARLESIRENRKRLADPRVTSAAEAAELFDSEPAVTWLAYGVHGNEISSPDAALFTAYHLLASRDDPVVETILRETLVVLVPTQNPDGRDRFVNHFRVAEGLVPDPHPSAAEHDEPWPGGRTNHYYFDLNRDWLALTQPETRGHVKALLSWHPQVFIDLHEMGGNSTYYFTPEAVPYNPHITAAQREALDIYGRNNARWFDERGFLYFTREVYDAFYPGYGASWPLFHGTIAATYEQASARGLVFRRNDGTDLHFRDGVRHHFVASIATAETTALNRRRFLEDFWEHRRSAIEEGRSESTRAYVLPSSRNEAAVQKLAGILVEQGVEVSRATAGFVGCGSRDFPAGSFVVDLAQPAKRLLRTILDPDVPLGEDFVREQERRRKKNLPDEIYDVTGWSLPQMFDVEAVACEALPAGDFEPATEARIAPGGMEAGRADVAYLVPWGIAGGRLLAAALREDLRVMSSDREIEQNGRTYPRGTLVFAVKQNPENLYETLERLAQVTGAEVVATSTGWVEGGVNFGSRNVHHVRAPRIALAWDTPTSANSAGATRFVIERQFGYPVTPIRAQRFGSTDFRAFDVIILPDGDYDDEVEDSTTEALKRWVQAGGTLIGTGRAVEYLVSAGHLDSKRENQPERESDPKKEGDPPPGMMLASEEEYLAAIEPKQERPDPVAGVMVRVNLDREHWLTAGMENTTHALVIGRSIFTPLTLDKGENPAIFAGPDDLVAGGYLWEPNRKQLAFKPLAMVEPSGAGLVIGITADPCYRAYLDGLNLLMLNAIFRGPARARPAVLLAPIG
ncbi:MAG TPA: M14 family metallopeptidase [Vicinamibacteria bacterium]|nr:M14 family metallopeptidase [Vicinamibacteria bacterium]